MNRSPNTRPRLGITLGDPAGIGPEVALRAILGHGEGSGENLLNEADVLLIGPDWAFRDTARRFGFRVRFHPLTDDAKPFQGGFDSIPDDIPTLPVWIPKGCESPVDTPFGREDPLCGTLAIRAIEEAADLAKRGLIDGIVTAPIGKAAIHAAGSKFPGHTEMLQSLSGSPRVGMMLVGGGLRVSLVTIHEALCRVPQLLTPDRVLNMIDLTHRFLCDWGIAAPRLALAALNPHAGDSGLFGNEEATILAPALEEARSRSIQIEGPLPSDTVFHLTLQGQFDAVVALYHDQALIPIKTLDFDGGVNVTMGLPFVRTSPDHGTAYAIAGQGIARSRSMRMALSTAIDLIQKRRRL